MSADGARDGAPPKRAARIALAASEAASTEALRVTKPERSIAAADTALAPDTALLRVTKPERSIAATDTVLEPDTALVPSAAPSPTAEGAARHVSPSV